MIESWLKDINWNDNGLLTAVAQDATSGDLLMLAWMNQESLQRTVATGFAHYWSRSRKKLWKKGEESGHLQKVKSLHLDCDGDALLIKVEQIGGIACHTGKPNCFYRHLEDKIWVTD